ncbi:MAG: hypothetical protein OEU32_06235 [Acidimicrobiia bacterium]|nr:hypothetical protein [Acidimicrobiia bacterium]
MPGSPDHTEDSARLRPVERVMLKLAGTGKTEVDIAWRLRRSPGYVHRTMALARLPRSAAPAEPREPWELRPIERTLLRARESGVGEAEMAARLRRSPAFVQRVGAFTDYKLARASKGAS